MRELEVESCRVELARDDITRQQTDAIVNAANTTLLGGGGVDGAIHRAGGHTILQECRGLGGCATGDAKVTRAGNLMARFVVHAVGPIYRDGTRGEAELLASAYRRSLEVAVPYGVRTIAFPSISTGAYRFPIAEAARIALSTVISEVLKQRQIELVRFVLFNDSDLRVYQHTLQNIAAARRAG
jgi:O-acetyl-ADP-ribose deacetylase (regulator of RNase III)